MTNLERLVELDDQLYGHHGDLNFIVHFYCAKKIGITNHCLLLETDKYKCVKEICIKCWNSEWEGDYKAEE